MAKSPKPKGEHGGGRKRAGRPAKYKVAMKRYTVRLTDEHAAIAEKLGDGDLATGVRTALDITAGKKSISAGK